MKQFAFIILFAVFIQSGTVAQVHFTKNGKISFFSATPLENIQADNNQVLSVINTATGEIQFSLLNNAFHFKKALMEEHFNDDYIESAKFPKSTFKGNITNVSSINFKTDGTYNVTISGSLNIHGVTKTIAVTGKVTIKQGKIAAASTFKIKPKDYNINIPSAVKDNIAENIELTINCQYEAK